ncbi:metallopeptidase family protein [Tsukamurella asaccharolytica]|uniref:Metallopeptidase family protein n=1 Tax=Tsukamurella asaccharolytica TaxID=2592067 RepID=A0A5C5R4W5_9ACTN|nr:metallopeptidase family protein [Tsukamurella asaccharolytica]TWS18150.1 metallopeptidase family protein [Tsukamurella asaccharolytica]
MRSRRRTPEGGAQMRRRVARDRRGHGMRGPLVPRDLPAHRTRSQDFDEAVLDAFAEIDSLWHDKLSDLDIAVDDVPGILPHDPDAVSWPVEVEADGPIPLARMVPVGIDRRGNRTRARLILFRRPLQRRAKTEADLLDEILAILVHQISDYLGVTEETLIAGPDAL